MEEKVLIIDRSKWRTGESGINETGYGETALLNKKGCMCCLGFELLRVGFKEDEIMEIGVPQDLSCDKTKIQDTHLLSYHFGPTTFTMKAININDNPRLKRSERESQIIEHFATEGITVQFINEYE